MSQAIYRKYRPQTFADVINQSHITITLKNQIATDSVSHAYLFAGPRGVGKTTIARLIAKAVNCEKQKDGESEPCGTCGHCQELNDGRAIDVIEIDAASHTGVENVRENIIEAVRFSPGKAKFKVFIIDEVHMLSTSAFNALLKTLEEPPAHAIFVLATTELHKIPQTIVSRCQRFDFHRIATDDMVKRLVLLAKGEKIKVDDDVLAAISRLSEGCLRDAESLLGQVFALGEKKITEKEASIILPVTNTQTVVDLVDAVVRGDTKTVLDILNTFVDQGGEIKNLTDELIDFIRTMMLIALKGPYHDHYDTTTMDHIRQFNKTFTVQESIQLLDNLLNVKVRPYYDALPQLPLELALIDCCGHRDGGDSVSEPSPTPPLKGGESKRDPSSFQGVEMKREGNFSSSIHRDGGDDITERNCRTLSDRGVSGKEDEKPSPASTNQVTIEEVRSKWKRCCEAVGKRNIALPLALQTAAPSKIENNELIIAFDKKFHFETFDKQKNIAILKEALEEVLQISYDVKLIFAKKRQEQAMNELANAFGGQIID